MLNHAVPNDLIESRQRVVKDRAGMLNAPAPGEGSPVERYDRDELQRSAYIAVTNAVGEARAYEVLRALRRSTALGAPRTILVTQRRFLRRHE